MFHTSSDIGIYVAVFRMHTLTSAIYRMSRKSQVAPVFLRIQNRETSWSNVMTYSYANTTWRERQWDVRARLRFGWVRTCRCYRDATLCDATESKPTRQNE